MTWYQGLGREQDKHQFRHRVNMRELTSLVNRKLSRHLFLHAKSEGCKGGFHGKEQID